MCSCHTTRDPTPSTPIGRLAFSLSYRWISVAVLSLYNSKFMYCFLVIDRHRHDTRVGITYGRVIVFGGGRGLMNVVVKSVQYLCVPFFTYKFWVNWKSLPELHMSSCCSLLNSYTPLREHTHTLAYHLWVEPAVHI